MSDRDKPGRCPNRECPKPEAYLTLVPVSRYVEEAFVWCRQCGVHGPSGSDEAEAVRLWNLLPRDAEPAGVARGEL